MFPKTEGFPKLQQHRRKTGVCCPELRQYAVQMQQTSENLVPVPDYRRTARRRTFSELPAALQERLALHIGGSITSVRSAGGGFTNGSPLYSPAPAARRFSPRLLRRRTP